MRADVERRRGLVTITASRRRPPRLDDAGSASAWSIQALFRSAAATRMNCCVTPVICKVDRKGDLPCIATLCQQARLLQWRSASSGVGVD